MKRPTVNLRESILDVRETGVPVSKTQQQTGFAIFLSAADAVSNPAGAQRFIERGSWPKTTILSIDHPERLCRWFANLRYAKNAKTSIKKERFEAIILNDLYSSNRNTISNTQKCAALTKTYSKKM